MQQSALPVAALLVLSEERRVVWLAAYCRPRWSPSHELGQRAAAMLSINPLCYRYLWRLDLHSGYRRIGAANSVIKMNSAWNHQRLAPSK
jgi:hypothetical protein